MNNLTNKGRCFSFCLIVSLLIATAVPTFGTHRTGDHPLPELITSGDFNGDGNIDLAVDVTGFDNIAIFDGDGQGNFTLREHVETDTLPRGLAAADLDKDGRLDLVSIDTWGYAIRIVLGDGLGGFVTANELNGDGEPIRIKAGDLNNDGNLDLVANGPDEGVMVVYLGNGHGGFSNTPIEFEDLPNDYTLALGDLNHDGNLDVVVAEIETSGSHVVIFLGDGTGNLTRMPALSVNPGPGDVQLADVNHDRKLDIILGGAGPGNTTGLFLSTYLGDGSGNFTLDQVLTPGLGTEEGEMAIGDFNEDGNVDVAFPVAFNPSEISTSVLIFLGDGTGGMTSGPVLTVGEGPQSAFAADFNHDGHIDLAVSNRTDGTLSILFGDGTGNFTTHAVLAVADVPAP